MNPQGSAGDSDSVTTAILAEPAGIRPQSATLRVGLDVLRILLGVLIVMSVSRIHQHFSFVAKLRPVLLLTALTCLFAFLNPRYLSTDGLLRTRQARLIVALGLLACIGTPFGTSFGNSARYILESYSKVIVAAMLLIAGIRHTRDLYTLVWFYVAACGILSWLGIFVFGLQKAGDMVRLSDLYTFDANDIGVVLMVGLALTLLVIQSSKGLARIAAFVILVGIGVTIARSGSRGAFLGLLMTGAALLVLARNIPIAKRLAFVAVTAVTLVFAAPQGYWDQMATLLSPKEDYNWSSSEGRKAITLRGISYMLSYPVFGLGINNFWRAECIDAVSNKVRFHQAGTGIRCTPPHNSTLQAGAELGLTGLTLWLMLTMGGIRGMLRLRRQLPAAWRHGDDEERFLYLSTTYFAVAMVGFLVTSFFVTFAWIDIGYILAALMAGLYVSVAQRTGAPGGPQQVVLPSAGPRGRQASYRRSVALGR